MLLSHADLGLFYTFFSYECLYFNLFVQNVSDIDTLITTVTT
jgi:hypothetical protein